MKQQHLFHQNVFCRYDVYVHGYDMWWACIAITTLDVHKKNDAKSICIIVEMQISQSSIEFHRLRILKTAFEGKQRNFLFLNNIKVDQSPSSFYWNYVFEKKNWDEKTLSIPMRLNNRSLNINSSSKFLNFLLILPEKLNWTIWLNTIESIAYQTTFYI